MTDLSPDGASLFRWTIAFTIICIMFMALRLWAALLQKRRFYSDDFFAIVAFASTMALEGSAMWSIFNGMGKPTVELTPQEIRNIALSFSIPDVVTWLIGTVANKLSLLCLYKRVFCIAKFRPWLYTAMAAVAVFGIVFLAIFFTNCQPVSQLWDPTPGGSCRKPEIEQFSSVAVNLAVDVFIIALPMPLLWRLQMPFYKRAVVSVMFSIGLITIGIMIWRLIQTARNLRDPDSLSVLAIIGLISSLELWLGIIAICVPTLGPLFQRYVKPAWLNLKGSGDTPLVG